MIFLSTKNTPNLACGALDPPLNPWEQISASEGQKRTPQGLEQHSALPAPLGANLGSFGAQRHSQDHTLPRQIDLENCRGEFRGPAQR